VLTVHSSFSWFALKVNTRSESLASKALTNRGYETFSPTHPERRRYTDRFKIVDVPVFPGYVLVRWDKGGSRVPILSSPAVQHFVCFGGQPATVPEQVVTDIRRMLTNDARPVSYPRCGDKVRVETGLLSGVEGMYVRRATRGQLVVSVHLIERSVALYIDEDQVRFCGKSSPVDDR
jgi:transcription antitermination factor NusG